jgi:hypothetical protein
LRLVRVNHADSQFSQPSNVSLVKPGQKSNRNSLVSWEPIAIKPAGLPGIDLKTDSSSSGRTGRRSSCRLSWANFRHGTNLTDWTAKAIRLITFRQWHFLWTKLDQRFVQFLKGRLTRAKVVLAGVAFSSGGSRSRSATVD